MISFDCREIRKRLVVKKARNLHYGDATDCMMNLVELENIYVYKCGLFDIVSYRSGRLEILHWSGFFPSLFVERHNGLVLIDRTRKTNIYDLSLFVTTVVDFLSI